MSKTNEITLPDEFASTMQQLVAEAEKTITPRAFDRSSDEGEEARELRQELGVLSERMASLESAIAGGFEKLSLPQRDDEGEMGAQLQRLEEQMAGLRSTETVNQRLFNSLHQELKSYRDNFLRESLQKPFIRDLVILFDDLSTLSTQMNMSETSGGKVAQWADNLQNALHALLEILHRMEVSEIEDQEMVDLALHRVVSYEPAEFVEDDGRIVMRLKRGFRWRDQVLRPAEVVAKRFN